MPYSPLATRAHTLHQGHGRRKSLPLGIILHTTGSTIVQEALNHKAHPLEYVVEHYLSHPEGPTYVLGHSGEIVQIADEAVVTWHAGISSEEAKLYETGGWRAKVKAHEKWDRVWNRWGVYDPRRLSHTHLPGNPGVNSRFIGIEMLPIAPTPKYPQFRFTDAQHQRAAELCSDIGARYTMGLNWVFTVLTHEDVNPLRRFDGGGGWDPGCLRDAPHFDINRVLYLLGGHR